MAQALAGQASAVADSAAIARGMILSARLVGEQEVMSAALRRLTALQQAFQSNVQQAVNEALNLKKAKAAGIMTGSSEYTFLAESKPIYALYLRGQLGVVMGDAVTFVDDNGTENTSASWGARVKMARHILATDKREEREQDRAAGLTKLAQQGLGKGASDEAIAAFVANAKAQQDFEQRMERESPKAVAERYITAAWKDGSKGAAWCFEFAHYAQQQCDALRAAGKQGAVDQPAERTHVVLPDEEPRKVESITPTPEQISKVEKKAAKAAAKAAAVMQQAAAA